MPRWLLLAAFSLPLAALAQPGLPADPCAPGTAVGTLEGLDVRARLFTNGNLFYGPGFTVGDGYQVPIQPADPDADKSPLFASALWLGGIVGGEVRAPSARYEDFPFRPGATGADGAPPAPAECAAADRIWTVSRDDVAAYLTDGTLTDDLRDWPVALGAPVLDGDGTPGNYNLAGGDQPAVRGDVTAFWAMTDLASPLGPGNGLPLGVDIGVEAFAFRRPPFAATADKPLATTTMYRFTVTNRSGLPIRDAYVGFFADTDLGNAVDDYLGTDTTRAMFVAYNADDEDDGSTGYGVPPAFGMAVVESPSGVDGQPLGLTATSYFESAPISPTTDPHTSAHVYYNLQGLWNDGTPKREGGNGYGPQAGPITTYVFAGDPVTDRYWSEVDNNGSGQDNAPSDRRGSLATGPFRLAPDASTSWTVALLFGQGADRFDSVVDLRSHADLVHALQAAGAFEPQRVTVDTTPTPPSPFTVRRAAPNPFAATTRIELLGLAGQTVTVRVADVLGREVERQTLVPTGDAASVTLGAGLAAGVYVVEVTGPGFTVPLTIAKTR